MKREAGRLKGIRDWVFISAMLVIVGVILVNAFVENVHLVQRYVGDDSFYYLMIARNFVNGIPSSFDGIHFTNGYHPLWMIPLVAAAGLVSDERGFLIVAVLIGILLNVLTLYLIWRLFRRYFQDSVVSYLVLSTAAFFLLLPSWYALESPLAILMTVVAISYFLRHYADTDTTTNVVLGLLWAGVVLARLDSIFVVGPAFVVRLLLLDRTDRRQLVAFAVSGVSFAVPIGLYLATNVAATGHLMPISGAIKSSFPIPTATTMPLRLDRLVRVVPPLVSACVVVALLLVRRNWYGMPKAVVWLFLGLNIGVVCFGIYEFVFQKDANFGVRPWHFAVPNLIMALSAGLFVFPFFPRTIRYALAVVIISVSIGAAFQKFATRHVRDIAGVECYETALWVRENTMKDDVIATTDSGIVAYFGRRRTINLDGLVNSFEYQRMVADGDLEGYLEENDVDYVGIWRRGHSAERRTNRIPIHARLYSKADTLSLARSDVVYSSPAGFYTIWKRQ